MIQFSHHTSQTMIALLQRVSEAQVRVAGQQIAAIGPGLLVLTAVEQHDTPTDTMRLAERVVSYRVFADQDGRMNLDVRAAAGSILLVPQFTLAADTNSGNRPSFTPAADPEKGRRYFGEFTAAVEQLHPRVQQGEFGADMQVHLVNDGPVTFWLQTRPAR
jgi:D-tyrosyl-tRNA(Tyr) deacylase